MGELVFIIFVKIATGYCFACTELNTITKVNKKNMLKNELRDMLLAIGLEVERYRNLFHKSLKGFTN